MDLRIVLTCFLAGCRICLAGKPGLFLVSNAAEILQTHRWDASNACQAPAYYVDAQLQNLTWRNCQKVQLASMQFRSVAELGGAASLDDWSARVSEAQQKCTQAQTQDPQSAAALALEAWGQVMMQGKQCCNLLTPPYCSGPRFGWLAQLVPAATVLAVFVVLLLSPSTRVLTNLRNRPPPRVNPPSSIGGDGANSLSSASARLDLPQDTPRGRGGHPLGSTEVALEQELRQAWLGSRAAGSAASVGSGGGRGSCLRGLPGAQDWAEATSSLFSNLWRVYGFQEDSVRCQHEHLLSLWRSHVALVADAAAAHGDGRSSGVDESQLLQTALDQLRGELLEGFDIWCRRFELTSRGGDAQGLTVLRPLEIAWADWPPASATATLGRLAPRLAEIGVFLLIWGEAGNLRFMPEVLYFLTDLALQAGGALNAHSLNAQESEMATSGGQSSRFLTQVVRPIYNTIFDEHYERIDIDVPALEIAWDVDSHRIPRWSLAVVGCQAQVSARVELLSRDALVTQAKVQLWLFHPEGFDRFGRRSFRILWAPAPSWCLAVFVSPGSNDLQLVLEQCEDDREAQLFCLDATKKLLLWAGSVSGVDDGLCFTVSGTVEPFRSLGVEFSKPVPADAEPQAAARQHFTLTAQAKGTGKDLKLMKPGYDKFMPANAGNYDDWNELFCDPKQLAERLVLLDGRKLYQLPPAQRFAALPSVDWKSCLAGVKTHRELHSWWGAFAGTHRVWLLHLLLFVITVCMVTVSEGQGDSSSLVGDAPEVTFAGVGLVIPLHAMLWRVSRLATLGATVRRRLCTGASILRACFVTVAWMTPVATFAAVRFLASPEDGEPHMKGFYYAFLLHTVVSSTGAAVLLFVPVRTEGELWSPSRASVCTMLARTVFWLLLLSAKFAVGFYISSALNDGLGELDITRPSHETMSHISSLAFSPTWDADFLRWCVLWGTGLLLYLSDTHLWFTLGCTIVGLLVGLSQRSWDFCGLTCQDAVALIPERFSQKVLAHDSAGQSRGAHRSRRREGRPASVVVDGAVPLTEQTSIRGLRFSSQFPVLWDRCVQHFRYEDKVDDVMAGELHFGQGNSQATWEQLNSQLPPTETARVTVPELFRPRSCGERFLKRSLAVLPDADWPQNDEMRWRLTALSRSLALDMPVPFRAPYIPGLTVLIPHYGEDILMSKEALFNAQAGQENLVTLMSWIQKRYPGEFNAFIARMIQTHASWPREGHKWHNYQDEEQWRRISGWASMRCQTLWRTVAGLTLGHSALDCHFRIQGDRGCTLGKSWDPAECFTVLVSMQQYAFFSAEKRAQVDRMLEKFPACLKIVYIDHEDKGSAADIDCVHRRQQRRYYSCLIDKSCPKGADGRRTPRLRIELPGFPILGDGKGDNQNHAIPFTRGSFVQCIDANQGAYFEQMLLLPCALGEFRSQGGTGGSKRIVGFPEHVTSNIGSIGDFAASAEMAFGTLLQRAYAALGARMHYGHPDMMGKAYMMQQGGVSKATKTVNLSEDIFAGMDFHLRGAGRQILHREYFHVSKGRDLGFDTVMQFFSKLAAGTGEQLLTRQVQRLCMLLPLPEFLSFHYAHGGYYLAQYIVSSCLPALVFLWLLLLVVGGEDGYTAVDPRVPATQGRTLDSATGASHILSRSFSWVALLWMVCQTMPLVVELWFQQGMCEALQRALKQIITLSPLHFIFQSKLIGNYVATELRYGGAKYVHTGRGLPTNRRPFLSTSGGLYLDFAELALYDGAKLLIATVLALTMGDGLRRVLAPWLVVLALTITSWLFAPFIFNPYQFAHDRFCMDLADWCDFFTAKGGRGWVAWFEKTRLTDTGLRVTAFDLFSWALALAAWFTTLHAKMAAFAPFLPSSWMRMFPLLPLGLPSLAFCALAELIGAVSRRSVSSQTVALHPATGAGVCLLLDLAELGLSLWYPVSFGWWKTVLTAFVLKYYLLSLSLLLVEQGMRLRLGGSLQGPAYGLRLWLYSHRLMTDVLVSSIIFWLLSVFVFFDRLRALLCEGCSLHQLLVFRDPGQLVRSVQEIRRVRSSSFSFLGSSMISESYHSSFQSRSFLEVQGATPSYSRAPPPQGMPSPTVEVEEPEEDPWTWPSGGRASARPSSPGISLATTKRDPSSSPAAAS